jgi:hypothetical protein
MQKVIVSTVLVLATAAGAHAQDVTASGQAATQAQAAAGVRDAAAAARIDAAMNTAIAAGVPATLLETRIAEGRAKGVSEARIATVVERRAHLLADVKAALEARAESAQRTGTGARPQAPTRTETATAAELTAAADAVERGVSIGSITRIAARSGEQRAAALMVLAELVAQGRTPAHALVTVEAALDRGGNALIKLGTGTASGAASVGAAGSAHGATTGANTSAGTGVSLHLPRAGGTVTATGSTGGGGH